MKQVCSSPLTSQPAASTFQTFALCVLACTNPSLHLPTATPLYRYLVVLCTTADFYLHRRSSTTMCLPASTRTCIAAAALQGLRLMVCRSVS